MQKYSLNTALLLGALLAGGVKANSQTVHVAGAGATAQFLTSAIGADSLALNPPVSAGLPTYSKSTNANCSATSNPLAVYHYSAKNAAYLVDSRSSNINPEKGNLWVVWTAACSDATGATGVQDIWLVEGVDGNTATRALLAQQSSGVAGAQIGVSAPPPAAGNLVSPSSLWPDDAVDVALPAVVYNAIGTGITNATVGSDVHINVALADNRPEDALFIITRALGKRNATLSGLGYRLISTNANFGLSILTGQGTGTAATPENFALSGGTDPVTGIVVPATTVVPIGAAPVVFAYNNNGAAVGNYPTDLNTGVVGDGASGGTYELAHLFDGTTKCDTTNPAFNGFAGTVANVNPVLREVISGTGTVVEYSLYRTTGNTSDSQEVGVLPTGTNNNPLQGLTCAGGGGDRNRAIGTSEVIGALNGTNGTGAPAAAGNLGYFFYGFANASKLVGKPVNYLTLDGVDPLGGIGGAGQTFPNCAGPCEASLWSGNASYPTLRNGTYPVWAIYRYVYYSSNTDPVGPSALAQASQDSVDTTDADYVPFYTAHGGIGGVSDGLSVYHSHFKVTLPSGSCGTSCTSVAGNNGTATPANATDGGTTLGDGDAGGDVGGVIEGPFGTPFASGYVKIPTTGDCTLNKGWKVQRYTNAGSPDFAVWPIGTTITVNGTNYTTSALGTTSNVYVSGYSGGTCNAPQPPATGTVGVPYYVSSGTPPSATTPGVLNKKR